MTELWSHLCHRIVDIAGTDVSRLASFLHNNKTPHNKILVLLLPLMTIGHEAGHYCHFRVLHSVNGATGRKKKKRERVLEKKEEKKQRKKMTSVLF